MRRGTAGLCTGLGWMLVGTGMVCAQQPLTDGGTCAGFAKPAMPGVTVVREELVSAGSFTLAGAQSDPATGNLYKSLPAFCRVVLKAQPSTDSDIAIEIWMPAKGWNGKFRGQGNGGFAGEVNYPLLALSVSRGYASAGTDTGHTGTSTDAGWALGHPEKIIDFGYRGIHTMTVDAKAVLEGYYGKPADRAYFASCSDGGREALMEAQRFPADYDGILAGAPAYPWTNLVTNSMNKTQALMADKESYIGAEKIPAIAHAVNAACDAADGVSDGILNDPRQCSFKPESLLCPLGSAPLDSCLTEKQIVTLKTLYAPTTDAARKQIYPATLPGGEDGPGGWAPWVFGSAPGKSLGFAFGIGYFSDLVYDNPHWDYKTFTVDDGLKAALAKTGDALNATDPDLRPFAAHGGKLILYHGWNDPAISPLSTLAYYQQVQKTDAKAASYTRLFMVPGMQHCSGGPGPSSFGQFGWRPGTGPDDAEHDLYLQLENWVEKGKQPEEVIAAKIESQSKGVEKITMTRPLCAYPKMAKYVGIGDTNEAGNFICVAGNE